ncbi:hypothetical protein [Ferrovibrio sp.]|uniref:hypothetical protein n=1 Tax=Ferrovibrio sp. TaxID=1917215 RepID=UPI000CC6D9EE|nr:hypothetical protein [Ferrovibrio sp.]PJI38785.1 MAG: hypothetical protein CTR53_16160 [Ferrovibrio sp.]
MGWKIDDWRREALHESSGVLFHIRGAAGIGIPDDFELVPPADHGPWSPARLNALKTELRAELPAARAENQRRRELATLVQSHAGGSTSRAASLIAQSSGNPVTTRTVQSWLISPARPSSRNCPAWAVTALAQHQPQPPTLPSAQMPEWAQSQTRYVLDKAGVELADASIADDRKLEQKWRALMPPAAAEAMIALERKQTEFIMYHHKLLAADRAALREATSFEDYQRLASLKRDDITTADFMLREIRQAIEQGVEEFQATDKAQ